MTRKNIPVIILIYFFVIINCNVVAAPRSEHTIDERIEIRYTHSRRIPHQNIIFTLSRLHGNDGMYRMHIRTLAMTYQEQNWNMDDENTRRYVESEEFLNDQVRLRDNMENHERNNIDIMMDIERDFFYDISNELREINFDNIIQENLQIAGADGSSVSIEFGTYLYNITITVWSPRNTGGEVDKINKIVEKVFEKAGLIEWYQ